MSDEIIDDPNDQLAPSDAQVPASPIGSDTTDAAPETPTPLGVRDRLAAAQIDVSNLPDDDAAYEVLINSLRREAYYKQQEPLLRAGQHYQQNVAPKWDAFQQWEKQQAQQAPQQAPQQQKSTVPEWDVRWNRQLQQDENGNIVVIPGGDPSLPQKYAAYQEYAQEQAHKLFSNPAEYISSHVEDRFKSLEDKAVERAIAEIDRRNQEQQLQQQSTGWEQQNSQWIYEHDAFGNKLDQFTPAGEELFSTLSGMNLSPEQFPAMADLVKQNMLLRAQVQQGQAAPVPAQQIPAQQAAAPTKKASFLEGARRIAARDGDASGTIPGGRTSSLQNPFLDIEQISKQVLQENGHSLNAR